MHKFNAPPNWPAPPEGWVPPEGWAPEAEWGPAPEGWNFWTEVPAERRPNSGTWWRSLVVAFAGPLLIVVAMTILVGPPRDGEVVGATFGKWMLPAIISSVWAAMSSKRWGWGRHVLTVVPIWFLFAVITAAGQAGSMA